MTTITNNRIRIAVYGVIFLSLAPFLVALPLSAATENIAKLVFVTDKQTIDPDVLSNTITVQTQNNAGGYEKVDEKTNLEFSSNSATGRFFSTSGAEVQEYMASGSYNKNFLYQDSATGNFTITVKATGDISDRTWQASQQITVGNINDDEDSDSDTDPTPTAATTTSSSSGGVGSGLPTETKLFSVNIGRDRTVATLSQAKFAVTLSPKSYEAKARVFWSFGDGAMSEGLNVSHMYVLPGKYLASVRVSVGDEFAETRVVLNVIDQDVVIVEAKEGYEGFVRIENLSGVEFRLGNFGLSTGAQLYSFPENFIVLPNSSVAIPARFSGLLAFPKGELQLRAPDGTILDTWTSEGEVLGVSVIANNVSDVKFNEIISSLEQLRLTALALQPATINDAPVATNNPVSTATKKVLPEQNLQVEKNKKNVIGTTLVEIPRKSSWFARLVSLPRRIVASVINSN